MRCGKERGLESAHHSSIYMVISHIISRKC